MEKDSLFDSAFGYIVCAIVAAFFIFVLVLPDPPGLKKEIKAARNNNHVVYIICDDCHYLKFDQESL